MSHDEAQIKSLNTCVSFSCFTLFALHFLWSHLSLHGQSFLFSLNSSWKGIFLMIFVRCLMSLLILRCNQNYWVSPITFYACSMYVTPCLPSPSLITMSGNAMKEENKFSQACFLFLKRITHQKWQTHTDRVEGGKDRCQDWEENTRLITRKEEREQH